jgi:flagellar assembly factor FliW
MQTATENISGLDMAIASPSPDKTKTTKRKLQSRFGEIEVDTSSKITFKHGLLGIPAAVSFFLTDLPHITTDQFKLLQCLEDEGLSFIVVPSQFENQLIKSDDLAEACKVLEFKHETLLVLFIVTIHEALSGRHISVNAKAPILIDAVNNVASQYVFQNSQYEIQHRIS